MFAVGSKKGWHSLPLVLFALLCPSITAPFLPFCHSTNMCVCLCKIKCSANTFLLLLSCSHASLSCVFSSYLAFSAFTLDGCAIISRDQWWPCPVFFFSSWSWRLAVFSYCAVPHLSFIGFLYVHKHMFTMVVCAHLASVPVSERGWTWKGRLMLAGRTYVLVWL